MPSQSNDSPVRILQRDCGIKHFTPDLGISPTPGLSQNDLLSDGEVVSAEFLPAVAEKAGMDGVNGSKKGQSGDRRAQTKHGTWW